VLPQPQTYGVWLVAMFVPTTAPARTSELIKATKTAPITVPGSNVSFPPLLFLRPSIEIRNETTAQTKANRYGTHMAAAPGVNVCSACHAAVIAPVIAAKFVNDWTVMKSLTAGLASVPVEASRGDSGCLKDVHHCHVSLLSEVWGPRVRFLAF
jgi:hypothetical protein